MSSKNSLATEVPHSWDLNNWPTGLYPETTDRARWLVRAYRDELMRCGALARVGRKLVVLGKGYSTWLSHRTANVPGFVSNNPRMRPSDASTPI